MKKVLISTIFILLTAIIHAQSGATNKGVFLLGGTSNLDITFAEGTPLMLGIKGGYFFADNIVGGLGLNYEKVDDFTDTNFKLFGRYYFKEKFFAGAGIRFFKGENTAGSEVTQNVFELEGGYMFYINDFIIVEPTFIFPLGEDQKPRINVGISLYL